MAHDRSGKPDKTSWNAVQQVRPHHGDALLDGAAQSVRYEGRLCDRSGQPDNSNSQEVADSTNFVMGSHAAEFVNKVNDQVRKRQKRMSNDADSGEEHSIIWEMFMAATMNAATLMGQNFMDNQNSIMNSKDLTSDMKNELKIIHRLDRVSKFCMDAGFISIGQYFMTKDTGELFYAKACRECTLPRNDGSSQPKGWIQGNTKIGPVLEVTTSCLYGKQGVEIRIWSLSEDNTQSWVRISHGSNKFVIDSNNNDHRKSCRSA